MPINEHPVAQVSCQIYILLPCDRELKVLARLHEDGDKFVADFRDDLGVVDRGELMVPNHVFVQNKAFLDVLFIWLLSLLSALRLSQLLPSVVIKALAIKNNKGDDFGVEFSVCLA